MSTSHSYANVKLLLFSKLFKFVHYSGADKSLARPGRKQATATEDFDVHMSYLLSQLEEY
jgi:hypothetical protein